MTPLYNGHPSTADILFVPQMTVSSIGSTVSLHLREATHIKVAQATCDQILAFQLSVFTVDMISYPKIAWFVSRPIVFIILFSSNSLERQKY